MAASKKWVPLESNPDVLNDFVVKLGLDASKYSFTDVFGLDEVRNGNSACSWTGSDNFHGALCRSY